MLHDPVTGEELVVFSMKGESEDIWRAEEESVILAIMTEYQIDREEAIRRLINSDALAPVYVKDQAFFSETDDE